DHVVVIGHGRIGQHVTAVLQHLAIPYIVVDRDATRIETMDKDGIPALFGDAANSEILSYAGLERASVLVVTVPDEATAEIVVGAARQIAPNLPIIVRAATVSGVTRLVHLGANDVIHPELEGGLELVRHTLLRLNFPLLEVQRYTDAVRHDQYEAMPTTPEERRSLAQLVGATRGIEVSWVTVAEHSPVVGQSLAEANLRARTGASVIAIRRDGHIVANPKSATVFQVGDRVGLLGEPVQLADVEQILEAAPS
ncbi:MAG: NAD-binding protein, partial [Anaerolineae bacterium]|nr:NAD-binding protein [Anaerolineae bacterium]